MIEPRCGRTTLLHQATLLLLILLASTTQVVVQGFVVFPSASFVVSSSDRRNNNNMSGCCGNNKKETTGTAVKQAALFGTCVEETSVCWLSVGSAVSPRRNFCRSYLSSTKLLLLSLSLLRSTRRAVAYALALFTTQSTKRKLRTRIRMRFVAKCRNITAKRYKHRMT